MAGTRAFVACHSRHAPSFLAICTVAFTRAHREHTNSAGRQQAAAWRATAAAAQEDNPNPGLPPKTHGHCARPHLCPSEIWPPTPSRHTCAQNGLHLPSNDTYPLRSFPLTFRSGKTYITSSITSSPQSSSGCTFPHTRVPRSYWSHQEAMREHSIATIAQPTSILRP
jgi:hypothetical protein